MALETSAESPAAVRTVSRLLGDYIGRLGTIWIEGQVAEFRVRPGARTQFITLRDTDVEMSVALQADGVVLGRVEPPLAVGQRVVVRAKPEYWMQRGSLTFRAQEIRAVGLGALLEQLARLRELLAAEGLFAPERKRPLPFLPHRIGLICGRASDALHDVQVNARERWPSIQFEVREVAVQGAQAVAAVTAALRELDADPEVDVIIVTRGGGSVEDLLPFSNETMVRAVADAVTPVVSAIGHEQDSPLIDFVADLRASTPTDAAKRVVPSVVEQTTIVRDLRHRARMFVGHGVDREAQQLAHRRARTRSIVASRLDASANDVSHLAARVRALSPAATLDRGYAIVTTDAGEIVRDADDVAPGGAIDVRVANGRFTAKREG